MNNSDQYKLVLEIDPDQLVIYLSRTGWSESSKLGALASVWVNEAYDDNELIVPLSREAKDFNRRVLDVAHQLSVLGEEAVDSILIELSRVKADVIRIRVEHSDVTSGTIPIHDGVLLFEKSRDLLVAAVRSTVKKKRFFEGGMSSDLSDFIDDLKFGQTERGSYVVNVISPVILGESDQQDHAEHSFTRLVSENLARGLTAIKGALEDFEKNEAYEPFDRAVEYGVSANLCDALIGLGGSKQSRDIEIRIDLGKIEESREEIVLAHKFDSEMIPFLELASDYFKDKYVLTDHTISGLVTKLHHAESEEYWEITIDSTLRDRSRSVALQVSDVQYWEAHKAHKNKKYLECTGDVHVTPRSAKLFNLSDFKVFGTDDMLDESS